MLTGIEKAAAKYLRIAASLARRLVLSVMFLMVLLSNSFLTREATESIIISLAFFVIMSSSRFCNLKYEHCNTCQYIYACKHNGTQENNTKYTILKYYIGEICIDMVMYNY